jgi:hypothetical protein
MNGEVIMLAKIVSNAKAYLNDIDTIYKEDQYVESVRFLIASPPNFVDKIIGRKNSDFKVISNSIRDWFEYLKNNKVQDIKILLGNPERQDVNLSAFANGISEWMMITKIERENYFVWYKKWEFDTEIKKWKVEFYGYNVKDYVEPKTYELESVVDDVRASLMAVSNLARKINEDFWADYFIKALNILEDNSMVKSDILPSVYSPISHKLLATIRKGWCFGGMGSWNDSPPYAAHQMGLDEDFKNITEQLYKSYLNSIEAIVNSYN